MQGIEERRDDDDDVWQLGEVLVATESGMLGLSLAE